MITNSPEFTATFGFGAAGAVEVDKLGASGGISVDALGFRDQPLDFSEKNFFAMGVNASNGDKVKRTTFEVGVEAVGYSKETKTTTHANGTTETTTTKSINVPFFSIENSTNSRTGESKTSVNFSIGTKIGLVLIPEVGFKYPIVVETVKPKR